MEFAGSPMLLERRPSGVIQWRSRPDKTQYFDKHNDMNIEFTRGSLFLLYFPFVLKKIYQEIHVLSLCYYL